jgi:transposase
MRSKAYRATAVKDVKIDEAIQQLAEGPVQAGVDMGKGHTMVTLRDARGNMLRPWKVRQPQEVRLVTERLVELSRHRPLVVALEPTGTYGDPLRQALCDAGLTVHRVSPKATSDYAEVFDGVPSQHDGKDAAVVAELAAIGKSQPWPMDSGRDARLRHEVEWMDAQQGIMTQWLGRLEGLLARHWPELTGLLDLSSATLLRLLAEYGGPETLRQDPTAAGKLSAWSNQLLKGEKIAAVLSSAESTVGVRMQDGDREYLQRCAQAAWEARQQRDTARNVLERHAKQDDDMRRVGEAIGMATACVLFMTVGNPRNYSSGAAYRKALGLNLKERSSGQHQGQLKITKRGPSIARRWLYLASLRMIQNVEVNPWYEQKKNKDQQRGGKGVVGVMRKLALAIYAVANGATFDAGRLFPGRNMPDSQPGSPGPGALPPDPRNLSRRGQIRTGRNAAAGENGSPPATRSDSAPGTALGSVSTGALSSVPVKQA